MPKHLTVNDEDLFLQADQINQPNGIAGLDGTGKIPTALMPGGSTAPVTSVNGELGNVVLDATDVGAVPASLVGVNNGVAPLDSTGRLPVAKLPTVAVQTVNGYSGPSVTLTAADFGSITQSAADLRYVRLDHMWVNVKQKGALGDNVADDTSAINSAIAACPPGGIVYFPSGAYRVLSTINVPPGITLMGTHTNLMLVTGLYDPNCSVKPLAGFTGDAVFKFLDQATGSYSAISGEQRILNLMIDGTNAPAGVDGIQSKGNVQNVGLRDVTIKKMTGNGIYTGSNAGAYPYSWRMFRVMLDNNTGHGMTVQQMTDLTMVDCQAIGNGANGFVLNNIANSQLSVCRAEWNGNHGYYLTGSWGTGTGSGGMQMSGCGTDRNGFNGVYIDATGNAPIVISNLSTRRDGRNGGTGGGGYAGLNANGATVPLIIGDWVNYPGVDDNSSGTNSPQYGASFTGTTSVQLENVYLHANTAGLNNGGGNTSLQLGANVVYATGPTNAPVRTNTGGVVRTGALVRSVKDYGAKGDDSSDDSPAFQAAINASAQGDVVYVPPGKYRLASTVVLTLGVILRGGGWSPHFVPRTNMNNSFLRPGIGNFVGTELIRVDPAPVGGAYLDSALGGGPRIEGFALNGRSTTNSVGGSIMAIKISAGVKDVQVRRVSIWNFTGDAIRADDGAGMVFDQVVCSTNGGVGFNLISLTSGTAGATDVDMIDCYSQGNGGDGYVLANPNAVMMTGCRSEWNTGHGFTFTGLNYSLVMSSCNTDRSGKNGFNFLTLDGGKPPLLVGCQAKRDGASAGTWAGFNFQGTDASTQAPGGILQGCSVYVGRNDDNTGTRSPQYGVQTLFARRVQMSGGWIEGTTGPYNDTTFAISKAPGIVQVTIDPSTGAGTISNSDRLDINGSSGANRSVRFFSRGSGQRWEVRSNSTSESGSNAGSDFEIARWSDAGAEIDVPFRITRSTGAVSIQSPLTLKNSAAPATPTTGAVIYSESGVMKVKQTDGSTITIASPAAGTAGAFYVVANNASAAEKAKANYQCDGVADDVEINAAVAAAKALGGGRILLSPGAFNIAAPIAIAGMKDENDARTITIQGCGQQVTELNVAANTVGITITDWAQVNISDLGILISGSGTGIQSVGVEDTGNNNTVSFWHSSFRNIRINGGFVATDTNWGMNLDMPWRSTFENVEIEGCRNGIKITNESTMQNAGDCVFSRFFVEIVGTGGYALYVDSIDGNMNQNTWIDFEAGANSTGCTGIWLGGTAGTASQRFIGNLNLEQFQTLINVANGNSNTFDCNYITCDTGGATNKGFVTGTNSYNNIFRAMYFNIASNDSVKVIEDGNTTSNAPNLFERIRLENNTNGTVTYSTTASTVLRDITTFNTGNALPAGLLQYPLTTVNSPEFTPQDHGFLTWTANPGTASGSGFQLTAGQVYLSKIKIVERSTVVSNITYYVSTAGTTLTAGQNFVGLYNSSGTRLALSADQTTNFGSTGAKTAALTAPQTLAVGTYYVAFLANGTGTVTNVSGSAGNTGLTNIGLTTATARSLNTTAGNTSLPASITLGSQSTNIAVRWAGLS